MPTLEKQSTYRDLDYKVIATSMGHRCGYVRIPEKHPLYKISRREPVPGVTWKDMDYEPIGKRGIMPLMRNWVKSEGVSLDCYFNVHGSITYSEFEGDGEWWIGFDCGHAGDAKDPALLTNYQFSEGVVRTSEYVEKECLSLIDQIKEYEQLRQTPSKQT